MFHWCFVEAFRWGKLTMVPGCESFSKVKLQQVGERGENKESLLN
jgi:hypothetical protein